MSNIKVTRVLSKILERTWPEVCFSGSVLLETFDIEVVSYDGNWSKHLLPTIKSRKFTNNHQQMPGISKIQGGCLGRGFLDII